MVPIARRPYFRGPDRAPRGPRVNDQIRLSPVRLIDQDNEQVGVVELDVAKSRAREAGLDLVEVAADVRPPVVRIMDYGKYKYEQSKKEKANKAKSKTSELKEVRLGRSLKIDPHDVGIRMKQAREFLMEGHKVQLVQNFRGREVTLSERGRDRLLKLAEDLSDIAKLEVPPRMFGRRMNAILAPDKAKIEQLKRKQAKAKDQEEAPKAEDGDEAEAPTAPAEEETEAVEAKSS